MFLANYMDIPRNNRALVAKNFANASSGEDWSNNRG